MWSWRRTQMNWTLTSWYLEVFTWQGETLLRGSKLSPGCSLNERKMYCPLLGWVFLPNVKQNRYVSVVADDSPESTRRGVRMFCPLSAKPVSKKGTEKEQLNTMLALPLYWCFSRVHSQAVNSCLFSTNTEQFSISMSMWRKVPCVTLTLSFPISLEFWIVYLQDNRRTLSSHSWVLRGQHPGP